MKQILIIVSLVTSVALASEKPLYFLWDVGSEKNKADRGDYITEISKHCNDMGSAINLPPDLVASVLPNVAIPTPEETEATFKSTLNVQSPDSKFFKFAWIVDSFKGTSNRVFVLLPEVHATHKEGTDFHSEILLTASVFSIGIIEASPEAKILNTREGAGPFTRLDVPLQRTKFVERAFELFDHGVFSPFTVVANAYLSSTRTHSTYLENFDLIGKELLLRLGEFKPGKSFEATLNQTQKFYAGGGTLNREILLPPFQALSKMSASELNELTDKVCIKRGQQMVDRAIREANLQNSNIIFVSYGASHHPEVANELRKQGLSFIAVIGRRAE